jgi:hypothetical protein
MTAERKIDLMDVEAEMVLALGAIEVLVDLCCEADLRSDSDREKQLPVLHDCLKTAAQRLQTAFERLRDAWEADAKAAQ